MGFMAGRVGVFAVRGGRIAGSVAALDETQSAVEREGRPGRPPSWFDTAGVMGCRP